MSDNDGSRKARYVPDASLRSPVSDDRVALIPEAGDDGTPDYCVVADLGGGGSTGVPVVRAFPFAFDTPEILTGAPLYTPTIGDILLDAWIVVTEAWDGIFPKSDIGYFAMAGPPTGLFELAAAGTGTENDMTNLDVVNGGLLVNIGDATSLSTLQAHQTAHHKIVPAAFVTGDPIEVLVTTDGLPGGGDPGSTQGAAILYLVTATPV